MKDKELKIPTHVGLIMDGNGRWAKKRLLPRYMGHSEGMKRMVALAEHAKNLGIKYLTVYALSTENLSRPEEELQKLYSLIKDYFSGYVEKVVKGGACVKVIGDTSLLPEDVQNTLSSALENAPEEAPFTFVIALAYGSRAETVRAANAAIKAGKEVTEEEFSRLLYTGGMPAPDLIIRTGGELRLSNFLMYQAAYAELYFTDVLFPDFTNKQFDRAIEEYSSRIRRFGKL